MAADALKLELDPRTEANRRIAPTIAVFWHAPVGHVTIMR